jgi:hypothetical protein
VVAGNVIVRSARSITKEFMVADNAVSLS